MNIYLLILSSSLIINYIKLKKNMNLKIIITILIFFVGLREFGGIDYIAYKYFFLNPNSEFFEKGFYYYVLILRFFNNNFKYFIFYTSFIGNFLLYKYLKNFKLSIIILIIYFGRKFIWHNFILLRQNFSILIFLMGIKYIYKRDIKKYLITILLATLFHNSAIFLLPLYLVPNSNILNKKNIIKYFLIGISCFIINQNLDKIINIILSFYKVSFLINFKYTYSKRINNLNYFVLIELLIFILLFKFCKKEKFKQFNLYFNFQIINFSMMIFFNKLEIIRRMSEYFELPLSVLIAYSIYNFKSKNKMIIIIFAYSTLRLIYLLNKFDNGDLLKGKWNIIF